VRLDAEEGPAYDDKRRDVEDEVRGQIVEVQAIVEHEPLDKRVKRKTQSAVEMGKKNNPLMGPGGGDELPRIRKPVRDVVRQVPGLPQFLDLPLRDGGGHPSTSRSGHDWRRLRWEVRAWALELEREGMDKQRRKKA